MVDLASAPESFRLFDVSKVPGRIPEEGPVERLES
jgi:hypothetical protein